MSRKDIASIRGVLLDTSFMIRFLSKTQALHANASAYFQYFMEQGIVMYFSTVSIAEYCVKGAFEELPFKNVRILPFNIFHAKEAGRFAKTLFDAKKKDILEIENRLIIPNDTKIFAQGSLQEDVRYFVTSDVKSKKKIEVLRKECNACLEHLDINCPCGETFGFLDFHV